MTFPLTPADNRPISGQCFNTHQRRHPTNLIGLIIFPILTTACSTVPLPLNGCTNENAILCENFERAPDKSQLSSNNLSLSRKEVFEGAHALQITSSGGEYNHNFLTYSIAHTLAEKAHYGRMMIWLDNANHQTGDFTFIQAEGDASAVSAAPAGTRVVSRARVDARFDHVFANYDTPVNRKNPLTQNWSTDCWKHPDFDDHTPPAREYVLPKGEWACVQWHFDTSAHTMQFWLNGDSLEEIQVKGTGDGCVGNRQRNFWIAPNHYDTLKVGIEEYHSNAKPRTLFIDQLEVSTEPVACPVR